MLLESPFAAALNHLLEAEPWAAARLAPFAGETLELRAAPWPTLRFTLAAGGRLVPAAPEAAGTPALVIALRPESLAAAARGEEHFLRSVDVTGNARLASEVQLLVRHLRWDYEEDLARWVGDAPAHRLAGLARDFVAWQSDTARRLAGAAREYVVEERRLLVARGEFAVFSEQVARLRDALERFEARLRRLD
jgi:ubiquinone biosynthesis protein UbiJ